MTNINLLVVQKHTIHRLDGGLGCFSGFIMYETISPGAPLFIGGNLAGQDSAECGKSIVKSLRKISD